MRTAICLALTLAASAAFAQTPKPLVPGGQVVTLWPAGHSTLKTPEQEEVMTARANKPGYFWRVVNIHNPSIELHLAPAEKRNGSAVILAAGGGNRELNVGPEGYEVADWLNTLGISAFVLRYRLQPYRSDVEALADTQRSIRLIRANAKEWGVDPNKIGIMGFSAGGEQAARVVLNNDAGDPAASDPVERFSSRPDFSVLIYPGWGSLDLTKVPENVGPSFMTSAGIGDASAAQTSVNFYNALFKAKVNVELHIYGRGVHAGGISPRNGIPFGAWHMRFADWLFDLDLMKKK